MITFQDKVNLNNNPDVPDINKIKDSDINALKAGVNANETSITNNNTYSTTEVKTAKTWINGKPIYRKVVNIGAITTINAFVNFSSGITNFGVLTKFDAYFKITQGYIPLNFYNSTDAAFDFIGYYDDAQNKVFIRVKTAVSECYAIIEYTKTTD